METTFLLLLFFVAHAAASGEDSDLKCSLRTEAELGKDVTLDCYCEPRCHVTHEELKWKFNQNTFVLAYIGAYDTRYQAAQFKGRAHLSSTEGLQDGNFPVTISTVRKSDEGIYTCQVGSKTCSVELRLKDPEFPLKCQEETVKAQVGQNVTLNCKSEPQQDLTEEIISWKFNSTIFLDFIDGRGALYKQFKDRVHTASGWKVSEGKLSVEISSVSESDAGVYTCSVFSGAKCTVTLIVKKVAGEDDKTPGAQDDNTTPASGGRNTGVIIGIVVVLAVVVVGLVALLIYRNNRTRRGRDWNKRVPSQEKEVTPLEAVRT